MTRANIISGIALLSASGSAFFAGQSAAMAAPPTAPAAFAQCKACHAVSAAPKQGIGPNLFRIANRRAGTQPGFAYSPAMRKSGIVWTRDNLLKFTQSPRQTVPGTRMAFGGVKDAAKAKGIVDYLMQAK